MQSVEQVLQLASQALVQPWADETRLVKSLPNRPLNGLLILWLVEQTLQPVSQPVLQPVSQVGAGLQAAGAQGLQATGAGAQAGAQGVGQATSTGT